MKRIINYVRGAVVLHNFLLNESEEDWIDANEVEVEDDLDPEPAAIYNQPDYARREELLYYLSELEDTTIN
jgi:hypothetical protein